MAEHTAKRADLVRQKVVLDNLSKTESDPSQNADKGQDEFDEETAKATGKSTKTVRRDKARGEAIPADVLGKIQGTELDKGTYLDKLKNLDRDEMREAGREQLLGQRKGSLGQERQRHLAIGAVQRQHDRLARRGPGDGGAASS